ncbi:SecY-interacting protein [Thalassotalea montiporae]
MTRPDNELSRQLHALASSFVSAFQDKHGHLPVIEKDEEWPSPCLAGEYSTDANFWQPASVESTESPLSFDNVEQALELSLHPDIKTYFTTLYSESFDLSCDDGNLTLLFPWSEADFGRLQENIIGHVLMKRKLKQDVTIFFALTDQDDFILSLDNQTGEVWVEQVGKAPHKKLADNLTEFLSQLTPVIYD